MHFQSLLLEQLDPLSSAAQTRATTVRCLIFKSCVCFTMRYFFAILVILDVGDPTSCQMAHFDINADGTTTSRMWDIKVTQYACGNEDKGGKYNAIQIQDNWLMNINSFFAGTIRSPWMPPVFYRNQRSHCKLCISTLYNNHHSTRQKQTANEC